MTQALVRQALETALQAWGVANDVPIAWENLTIDKPDTVFAEAFVLPSPMVSLGLERVHRAYTGVFQVSLQMPQNAGPGGASALVASLDDAFPGTTPFIAGGLKVWITSPMGAAPAIPDGTRYVVPVSCSYRADHF